MTAVIARNTQRVLMLTAAFMLVALGGLAGARTAYAAPSSSKTIKASAYDPDAANAPFPDLAVTVSQTTDLIQQGIKVSWTGAKKSTAPQQQTGGTNFFQIMQCWGDEPGSNGARPDRTTCQYGGMDTTAAQRFSYRDSSEVAPEDTSYTAVGSTFFDPTMTAIPFVSATGVTLSLIKDGKYVPNAPDLDNNQFFTKYTTNEVSWAGSGADGSGSVSFELQTAQQSPGLGCGAAKTAADGAITGAPCWLVVVPRGTTDASGIGITESALFWETWKHHIAIRLGFKPAGLSCALGAAERQISGSELLSAAVGQWQPKLCHTTNGAVYSLLTGPESDAALAANGTAVAPMALVSRALSADGVTDNLAYAPIGLTGISIGFAIDHRATVSGDVPDTVTAKERQAFTTLNLTPRVLAKLLTTSYTATVPSGADASHLTGPRNVTVDPDFLAINSSDWKYMAIVGVGVSDALAPLGRSDAAFTIWSYIMADADAKEFMDGQADPWGMKVNPYYSTNASVNPTGTGLTLPRDDFPKADPVEYAGTSQYQNANVINLVTWRPFSSSLETGGYLLLRGDPLALGGWDPTTIPPKYGKGDRGLVGLQAVIGLTDTSAAGRYQVAQASLLNPSGKFVAPTKEAMTAAAAVMTASAKQKQVVGFDPTSPGAKSASAAYPLTIPIYAAANPAMTDTAVRKDYATFITYAAGDGQIAGTGDGQLPDGYAPIPAAWKTQAIAAAAAIAAGATATPTPTASSSSAAPTTAAPTTDAPATGAAVEQTAPAEPATTAAVTNPNAAGATAPSLTAGKTGDDPGVGPLAAVVPVSAAAALAAALAIPPLTRRRRL